MASSKRRNPNVVLDNERLMLHGTSAMNVRSIAANGLSPRGSASPHMTKTRDAIFLTDSMEGAVLYSGAGDPNRGLAVVVLNTRGLSVEPDIDDVGDDLEGALQDLASAVGMRIDIGDEIPDELYEDVGESLEAYGSEMNSMPLAIHEEGGKSYLIAEPWVEQRVALLDGDMDEVFETSEEFGLVLSGQEYPVQPALLMRQYLCRCVVPVRSIRGFFLNVRGAALAKIKARPRKTIDVARFDWAPEGARRYEKARLGFFRTRDVLDGAR